MSACAELSTQSEWAAALLDAEHPVPAGLRCWNGSKPILRFDVYRNNVLVSLVEALAESFPVTRALVGEEFFGAMGGAYVRRHPPASPVLSTYGDGLPAFIAGFGPASSVPYLADVASLEAARIRAYHAPDQTAMTSEVLAPWVSRPAALAALRLVVHPSVSILSSAYAIVSLWAAHQRDGDVGAVDPYQSEHALVVRTDLDVAVIAISGCTACFVRAIAADARLGDAAARAFKGGATDELTPALALLMRSGALAGTRAGEEWNS